MARVNYRKLSVVFKREYLERVRSKWFLIGTLLGPVFFGAVTILPSWIAIKQGPANDLTRIAIYDGTGTGLGKRVSADLVKRYPAQPAPRVIEVAPDRLGVSEDEGVNSVVRKDINGFFVLDSNTVSSKSVRYVGRNAGSISDVEALMTSVKQQVLAYRLEKEGLDPTRVNALTAERLETRRERIGDKGREKGGGFGNLAVGGIISFLLYFMIVLYGQQILRGVMDEKTTRVAEVVVSSVSTDTLLAGKVLGVGMVAITQVVGWLALTLTLLFYVSPMLTGRATVAGTATAGSAAVGVPASGGAMSTAANNSVPDVVSASLPTVGSAVVMFAYFVFGFIFYASLFAAVGSMISNQEDVQQAAMPVMLLLIGTVIFISPILTNPGSGLARTMSLLPFSAPILMPLRMSLISVPPIELAASLGGVILACVVAIWVSARIYRVGLLMYGKRPSLSELSRWVRYSN